MAARSSVRESRKDREDEADKATTSENVRPNATPRRKMRCYFCQRAFFLKHVLRLVIKECSLYATVLLIRLDILDGVVKLHSEKTINFFRLSSDQRGFYPTQDDFARSRSTDESSEGETDRSIARRLAKQRHPHFPPRWKKVEKEEQGLENGIFETLIFRLAKNLDLDTSDLEECIDHVITGHGELLLDMDLRKLRRASGQDEDEIERTIINMFWQPKGLSTASVPNVWERAKEEGWFRAVDRGRVVPFHSPGNPSCFGGPNTARNLLGRCVHEIEESTVNAFSWYLDEYFYHDFVFPRCTLSYARYANYRKNRKICNPRVMVIEGNPLELDTNFAYVIALNFYSHHKYVRQYMHDIGLLRESIVRVNKDVPFVVRSLNPITRQHIFHMVYKRSSYSRPSYEDVFKSLVMLRDAMFRLSLRDVAMCKIGCCCERLDFGKVLRMTEYVFLDSDINVRIGLNLTNCCWHLRGRTGKRRERSAESIDLYLERIDRFFFCDGTLPTSTGDRSINDDEEDGEEEGKKVGEEEETVAGEMEGEEE